MCALPQDEETARQTARLFGVPRVYLHVDDLLRAERDNTAVHRALAALAADARGRDNLMPAIIAAVETYATLGEICDVFREVFGVYHEPVFF